MLSGCTADVIRRFWRGVYCTCARHASPPVTTELSGASGVRHQSRSVRRAVCWQCRSVSRVASCRLQVSTTGAPSVSYAKMKSSPRAAPYHVPSPSLSAFYGNGFSSSWLDGAALPSAFALGIPAASTTSAALSPDPPGQGTLRAQT